MTENVIWQPNKVSAKDRYRVLGQKGLVVWFTGLSGSGKSTIAVELEKMLNDAKKAVYLLDGDNIRHGIWSLRIRTVMKTYGGLEKFLPCFATQELLHWLLLFPRFVRCAGLREGASGKINFLRYM